MNFTADLANSAVILLLSLMFLRVTVKLNCVTGLSSFREFWYASHCICAYGPTEDGVIFRMRQKYFAMSLRVCFAPQIKVRLWDVIGERPCITIEAFVKALDCRCWCCNTAQS
jgi:hypothetical protein